MKKVKCETCGKEVLEEKAWIMCGRDYDNPSHFCTDSCRMMLPFKKKLWNDHKALNQEFYRHRRKEGS